MAFRDKILILDFGSQYTHLLARRIRDSGVYSEIHSPTISSIELQNYKGVILSGGPSSVYEKNAPKFNKKIFSAKIPILGLCYGQQLMGQFLGGKILPVKNREYGSATLLIKQKTRLFQGLSSKQIVWMSHGDQVKTLPNGFQTIASTIDCPNAVILNEKENFFGLQFHPEVTHTKSGSKILSNFIFKICI
ncbi:MAG: glutamine-hydrolyzing GMP synthase [Bacteroidetes bacterium]|nr:glutamine-hydrolyzing GMP synthase [Bacteroidota bacterium]